MCAQAGMEGEELVFFLDDTQITHNAFLADINSILVTGAVVSQTQDNSKGEGCSSCEVMWLKQPTQPDNKHNNTAMGARVSQMEAHLLHFLYTGSGGPGEVPDLFTPEEMAALADSQPQAATTPALLSPPAAPAAPFWDRVRANLHIILSMSPASPAFCERCRMFPGELM